MVTFVDGASRGARLLVVGVGGGPDLTIAEVEGAIAPVYQAADEEVDLIWGQVVEPKMQGKVKVTVIATGLRPAEESGRAASTPGFYITLSRTFWLNRVDSRIKAMCSAANPLTLSFCSVGAKQDVESAIAPFLPNRL
jgi:cell division GTPase FtsZ